MTRLFAALALTSVSCIAFGAPPITEPVEVTVANPVLPVEVSNADPIPVAIVNGATPYMVSELMILLPGSAQYAFDVPEGKRLMIETIAVGAWIPIGTSAAMILRTRLDNSYHYSPLALESLGVTPEFNANIPKQTFAGTHSVRIAVDGDSNTDEIRFYLMRSSAAGENTTNNFATVSISGYLVDR